MTDPYRNDPTPDAPEQGQRGPSFEPSGGQSGFERPAVQPQQSQVSQPSPQQWQPEPYGQTTPAPAPGPQPVQQYQSSSDPYGQSGQGYGASPYGASPYGQSGYGQQPGYGAGYGQMQPYTYGGPLVPEHPRATTVLVLGILGFMTGITGFVAWYLGGKAKKEIQAGAPYRYDGMMKAGHILGMVSGILTIALVAFYMFLFMAVVATGF